jgi:anaerobic magnesium-protoporphyrin IX monomethyl ester cyclase
MPRKRTVVLVQPHIGEWDWVRSRPHFPLGLLHAASAVAQEYPVVLIDQRVEKDWKEQLERHLEEEPLCVALTSMSGSQIAHALSASRFVKKRSRVPVIWGGLHASMLAEQTLAHPSIDIVVRGEGEETFLELVQALEGGASLEKVRGISFLENGHPVHTEPRDLLDMERLPEVPYHLVTVRNYMPSFRGVPSLNMETSRGCPNRCTYCYNFRYNRRRWRAQGPDRVIARLRHVAATYGVRGIYFTDDNFFADVRRGLAIARRILDEGLQLQWQLQGVEIKTILQMSEADLDLLEASGCVRFSFGADSGSDRVLQRLRKNHTVRDIIEVNRRLAGRDITIYYSFISGMPGETLDDLTRTKDLALRLTRENRNARVSPIYNYFPFPGAELYDELIRSFGYVPPQSLEEWSRIDYGSVNLPFLDPAIRKTLERLYVPSLCIDRKFHEYNTSSLLRLALDLYRPLARLRVERMWLGWPCETRLAGMYRTVRSAMMRGVCED